MKREIVTLFVTSAAVFLVACGSDSSGTNANDGEAVSVQAETFDDLPNCSKSREGDLAEVLDERKAYRCQKGAWEFDHDVLDTVKTEDELPACIGKKEGLSLFVKSERAAYTCDGKRWTMEDGSGESGVVEYETEDDLPNCVVKREGEIALIEGEAYLCDGTRWKSVGTYYATEDSLSNCTAKREGEKAYIADEGTALKCTDGEWKEVKAADQGRSEPDDDSPKSSSSTPDTPTSSSTPIEDLSSSSIKVPEPEEGTLTDSRDGQTYKTVVIGTQTWMAENLNYEATSSVCPLENSAYCKKYGRLYLPGGASTYCPSGWHVPSLSEWTVLYNYVDANNGTEGVGKSLKSTTGWYEAGTTVGKRMAVATGKDQFGFSALPAGSCWWDTPSWNCYSDDEARFLTSEGEILQILYDSDIITQEENSDGGNVKVSVRCVKNASASGNGSSASTSSISVSSYAGKDSSYYDAVKNTLTDFRNGQTYRTTTIAPVGTDYSKVWMAENLNYETANSWCASGSETAEADCSVYGRRYTWMAAVGKSKAECYGNTCDLGDGDVRGVCPKGWHLPSHDEWDSLITAVGGFSTAGAKLKSASGWNGRNGTDAYSFSALPAGHSFWSSTQGGDYDAHRMTLENSSDYSLLGNEAMTDSLWVRCLKDFEITGCTCSNSLTTSTNDLAVNNPVKYTWSVKGCNSEGSKPLSYTWSGSATENESSVIASYEKQGNYTADVTVSNTDGKSILISCSSVSVKDSDNPYVETTLAPSITLQTGGYYIPKCGDSYGEKTHATLNFSGSTSDNCLEWFDDPVVEWTGSWGTCHNGQVVVDFPLYITIPDGESMSISCY